MSIGWRAGGTAATLLALVLTGTVAPATADEFRFPESDEVMDGPGLFSGEAGVFTVSRWPDGEITYSDKPPKSGGNYRPPGSGGGQPSGSSGAQGGYQPPVSYQGGALSYPGQPAPVFRQPYRQPYPQAYQQPAYQQPYRQPGYQQQAQQPPAYGQPYRPPAYRQPYPQPPQAQGGANPGTGE